MSNKLTFHSLLGDRTRLNIMGMVATAEQPLSFSELLETLSLSKGNLSSHIKKLEDEGFVKVNKEFVNRVPRTTYECTPSGRRAIQDCLDQIQGLLAGSK